MQVGDIRVDALVDGTGRLEPTATFAGTTEEDWAPHRDLLDEDGKLEFPMGGFLVRSGERVVLVDLGIGPRELLGIQGGALLSELASLGVSTEDVSDVVFTHLHADHVGWASHEGAVVFPAATYRCAAADWQHFAHDHPAAQVDLLRPAESHLELWDGDGPLLPGLDTMVAPGHTPGSTVLVVSSGERRALLLGDVVHCPVELLDDEWAGLADVDPELAKRTRIALSREIEGTDVPVAASHFPGMRFGRLLPAQGRRRWVV